MQASHSPLAFQERTITELDHVRLARLLRSGAGRLPGLGEDELDDWLNEVSVVPSREVAPDIVTMYSQVEIEDCQTRQRQSLTLCYPADVDLTRGFISVLSPIGMALLGLRIGDVAHWRTPDGAAREVTVMALPFQPESTGNYTT